MVWNYVARSGRDPGFGPACSFITPEEKGAAMDALLEELGIRGGSTWILEVNDEGMLQFTRPMTEDEKGKWFTPIPTHREFGGDHGV